MCMENAKYSVQIYAHTRASIYSMRWFLRYGLRLIKSSPEERRFFTGDLCSHVCCWVALVANE